MPARARSSSLVAKQSSIRSGIGSRAARQVLADREPHRQVELVARAGARAGARALPRASWWPPWGSATEKSRSSPKRTRSMPVPSPDRSSDTRSFRNSAQRRCVSSATLSMVSRAMSTASRKRCACSSARDARGLEAQVGEAGATVARALLELEPQLAAPPRGRVELGAPACQLGVDLGVGADRGERRRGIVAVECRGGAKVLARPGVEQAPLRVRDQVPDQQIVTRPRARTRSARPSSWRSRVVASPSSPADRWRGPRPRPRAPCARNGRRRRARTSCARTRRAAAARRSAGGSRRRRIRDAPDRQRHHHRARARPTPGSRGRYTRDRARRASASAPARGRSPPGSAGARPDSR